MPARARSRCSSVHPVPSLLFDARRGDRRRQRCRAAAVARCERCALGGRDTGGLLSRSCGTLAGTRAPQRMRRVAVRRARWQQFHRARAARAVGRGRRRDAAGHASRTSPSSRQEIAAANKELESFMSAAGHDLRGAAAHSQRIRRRARRRMRRSRSTKRAAIFLKEILKASDRMDGLIDGLLTLSRAGRAEMNCERLDLSTLVELVSYELRHAETRARSRVRRSSPASTPGATCA